MASFASLPPEIKLLIFSYFKPNDLSRQVSYVCQEWYHLSKTAILWKELTLVVINAEKQIPAFLSLLHRCPLLTHLTLNAVFHKTIIHGIHGGFTWYGSGMIMGPASDMFTCLIPTLTRLHYTCFDFEKHSLEKLNHAYPQLDTLIFHRCAIPFYSELKTCIHLKAFTLRHCRVGRKTILADLVIHFPHLESLCLEESDFRNQDLRLLAVSFSHQLKKLTLDRITRYKPIGLFKQLVSLTLKGPAVKESDLKELAELPYLESLSLENNNYNHSPGRNQTKGFYIFFSHAHRQTFKKLTLIYYTVGKATLLHIGYCPHLQVLHLKNCDRIRGHQLLALLIMCSHLRFFTHTGCSPLTEDYQFDTIEKKKEILKRECPWFNDASQ